MGGGPAGMILGLLLAHQGIKVLVLESHKDFSREYRGEVLMPRFTQMMKQIGLFDYIEKCPHLKLKQFELFYKNAMLTRVDFTKMCEEAPFAIWMPQKILLDALYDKARTYPNFEILFEARAKNLIEHHGKILGVVADQYGHKVEVHARVTVGADGRASLVRRAGNFDVQYKGHEFDVIWFTIPKPKNYENTVRGFFSSRHNYLVLPKYPDSIQCGLIVPIGKFAQFKKKGVDSIRREILSSHWVMKEFAENLKDFGPFNVLQARVSFVRRWAREGCLLVGDAAHTCSPAGAVGVSVAVATAIVASDVLAKAVRDNDVSAKRLGKVQALRSSDVREIQHLQKVFTNTFLSRIPLFRWVSLAAVYVMSKTGVFFDVQKKIMVMKKPLPIDQTLHF